MIQHSQVLWWRHAAANWNSGGKLNLLNWFSCYSGCTRVTDLTLIPNELSSDGPSSDLALKYVKYSRWLSMKPMLNFGPVQHFANDQSEFKVTNHRHETSPKEENQRNGLAWNTWLGWCFRRRLVLMPFMNNRCRREQGHRPEIGDSFRHRCTLSDMRRYVCRRLCVIPSDQSIGSVFRSRISF